MSLFADNAFDAFDDRLYTENLIEPPTTEVSSEQPLNENDTNNKPEYDYFDTSIDYSADLIIPE